MVGALVFCLLAAWLSAAENTGRVCVEAIPRGDNWSANDTGAKEASTFRVQIDDLAPVFVSTNSSGVFTNLSLTGRHLVKIRVDNKPLTSFRFSFRESGSDHMRLWYSPFYGTWSLSPVWPGQKCACPRQPPPKERAGVNVWFAPPFPFARGWPGATRRSGRPTA